VLTYPHRLVLKGDLNSLNKEIDLLKRFKFKVDFVIENGFAYIEYLDKHEKGISEEIPEENWRTVIYRKISYCSLLLKRLKNEHIQRVGSKFCWWL